jgi:hypothetical protein
MAGNHRDDHDVFDNTTCFNVFEENDFNIFDWLNLGKCESELLPSVTGYSSCTPTDGFGSGHDNAFPGSIVEGETYAHDVDVNMGIPASRKMQDIDDDIEELELKLKLHELRKERERALRSSKTQDLQIRENDFLNTQIHGNSASVSVYDSVSLETSQLAPSMVGSSSVRE